MAWVRDGTITDGKSTQIDLRDTSRPKRGQYNWISVKGNTDKSSEQIVSLLLNLLNKKDTAIEALRVLEKAVKVMDLMRAHIEILRWENGRLAKKTPQKGKRSRGGRG